MIYLKLFFTAVIWGGTFVVARYTVQSVEPFTLAFLRFLVANLILLPIGFFQLGKELFRMSLRQFFLFFILGLTGIFLYNIFFFAGLESIEASRASILVSTNPIFIALFSSLFRHESINGRKFLGLLLSMMGAIVVISRGQFGMLFHKGIGRGETLILGCVASWVLYSIVGKFVLHHTSPLKAVFWSMVVGDVLLFFPAWRHGLFSHSLSWVFGPWLGILYMAILSGVIGFIWYYQGIEKLGSTLASQFINMVPISAVALGILFLHEPLTVSLLVGTVGVIGGVILTQTENFS